jgi:cytochrome c
MSSLAEFRLLAVLLLGINLAQAAEPRYDSTMDTLGRPATTAEVAAWDIDVRPDFTGLPPGSGSVADGEAVWLDQCVACHGDFGDSNEYFSPLVLGNVTEEDMASGHVASLLDPTAVRTTMMKVATISTLWDYINRAMPWTAPKSLTTDEVYAVLAYLLSLAYIVEDDFVLSQGNIAEVQARLPNRNGMSRDHGLWSVAGKGDVQGSACTRGCDVSVEVTSFIPEYARDAHGNLRDQHRLVGPVRGQQTVAVAVVEAEPVAADPVARDLLASGGCLACHQFDRKLIGPSFGDVAARYAAREDAMAYLVKKISNGGSGVWGTLPMPPAPLDEDEISRIAAWLVAGADAND